MHKKILLVDDHQLILDGITAIISELNEFDIVGSAVNGKEALRLIDILNPDIVLMDIDMPYMNGVEACRVIKSNYVTVKVIILTMHNEVSLIRKLMQIGADGYILKSSDRAEFYNALCTVSKGKKFFSAEVTENLAFDSVQDKMTVLRENDEDIAKLARLTEREIEVLKLISEGLSNKEIGENLFISHRTVDTHRTNLMKKLDAHNIASIIKFAIKNGLTD